MEKTMRRHFPVIRDRKTVLDEIQSRNDLKEFFDSWEEEYQEEFLDICTGVRGVKLLYDTFFKEIMNPDVVPERLEEVLSLILQTKVEILRVLPNDSARIAAEKSLLVMDIVVQLADGSIANVEVQKIPYKFPGERSACYSSDLLLRQYKRVRGEKGKKFKYQDIKKVYTIVFLEKSSGEFHAFQEEYIHRGKQTFDTGLQLELLQEYVFIALDIFHRTYQKSTLDNLDIRYQNEDSSKRTRLEAWLTFLSDDNPKEILRLLEEYPELKKFYEEVYEMCRNMERFMGLFSKELAELDKNTVEYMIDEMQETINEQKETIDGQQKQLDEKNQQLEAQSREIAKLKQKLDELRQ